MQAYVTFRHIATIPVLRAGTGRHVGPAGPWHGSRAALGEALEASDLFRLFRDARSAAFRAPCRHPGHRVPLSRPEDG